MSKSKLLATGLDEDVVDAYNQRGVMSLPGLSVWTREQMDTQTQNNRILQPGFMHRNAEVVIDDALMAKADWLTTVCCPSASAAIMLHIGKEMVTNYQVSEKQLNIQAHALYASLITEQSFLDTIENKVDKQFDKLFNGPGVKKLEAAALDMLRANYHIEQGKDVAFAPDQLAAAQRLVGDMERRKILDSIVSDLVNQHISNQAHIQGLTPKTLHEVGTTHDFAFLGAAGSGKSTIAQQYVSDGPSLDGVKIDKRDCIILATDNYRAFTMPGTDDHEAMETKDVFTRTQDIAYMVKELVEKEIRAQVVNENRSNLICDCVTLSPEMKTWLTQNPDVLVSKVAAYRGEPGYVGIAERAERRARDEDADPADKGRFVNTTSLFEGHAGASKYLLYNIPPNSQTEILDTNVDRSKKELPRTIAVVDSRNHTIEITDLRVMSEFLNKQNINKAAQNPVELIFKADKVEDKTTQAKRILNRKKAESLAVITTTPENKAKAVLALVGEYSITLKDRHGTAYAELLYVGDGKVKLEVLDEETFKQEVSHPSSPGADVLRHITMMTAGQTLEAAIGTSPDSPESVSAAKVRIVQDIVGDFNHFQNAEENKLRGNAQIAAENSAQKQAAKEVQRIAEEPNDVTTEKVNAAKRVLSAAIGSPKIITGNYSAIMNCLNEVLTNTVTIVPDQNQKPVYFIAEPMWLDSVDRSYDQEPWGQGIDAFPPAVQKFAQENLEPAPERGVKLTWGQVRELRAKMLDHLERAPGFTVIKGEIANVEQVTDPEDGAFHEMKIAFTNRDPVSIPFTGNPVVLDLSQRPRPGGNALSGEPTVLYRQSREKNEATSDVPIFCAGAGAQAAWVVDKMDNKRTYNVIYRGTLDFRIANAILASQDPPIDKVYTSANALVAFNEPPLGAVLEKIRNGTVQTVSYKKDNGELVQLNIALYSSDPRFGGNNKKLIKLSEFSEELSEKRGFLIELGVPAEKVNTVLESLDQQWEKLAGQDLSKDQLAVQLNTEIDPPRVDVGFALNTTGWVALNNTKQTPFWGAKAHVTTGETLTGSTELITTSSLLPGSGIPRMLAMKGKLQEMRGDPVTYDVRALAFTGKGFNKMCDECNFSAGFRKALESEIRNLETPDLAGDPVNWIMGKYVDWLDAHPEEIPEIESVAEKQPSSLQELVQIAKGAIIANATQVLNNNVNNNDQVEVRARI